ncbi:MAG: response regulator [candidate division NC10 bacterium]|nr:response regulator [candidate division NC10 bacterium]
MTEQVPAAAARGEAVLVVDDERLMRDLCAEILSGAGFAVRTARDAREGLARLAEEPVAVLRLDVMLPNMGGLEALRVVADRFPLMPVVMITAYTSQQSAIEALKAGAYDYLPKPFQREDLIRAVSRAAERHHLLKENARLVADLQAKVSELSTLYALSENFARELEHRVKERTEALRRNQRLVESIIANMASGLLVTDTVGHITLINRQGEQTLRRDRQEILGQHLSDLFPGAEAMLEVPAEPVQQEITLPTTDGGQIPLGFSSSFLLDDEERREGVIVVFRDLSEIKALQEEILRKDRLAAIGRVAAGVAHEIRNPLFGITSVAQILNNEVEYGPAHRELVTAMLSESRRLNALVNDLLLYGRPSSLERRPVELGQVWEEILGLQREELQARGVTFRREIPPDFPAVPVDPDKMKQVFLNLLKNAVEATPPGGAVTVALRLRPAQVGRRRGGPGRSRFAEIALSDTGCGIPAADRERIFDLFHTTKPRGSGLGLAICRRLVEDHGGRILVDSKEGEGSTFTVLLPLEAGAPRETAPRP